MAEALLRARLIDRAPTVEVGSFGRLFDGEPADPYAQAAVDRMNGSLDGFRSRRWTRERVESADLVLTMERAHVRDLVLLSPTSAPAIFTLPEFVRLADVVGPREPGTPLVEWVARIGRDRQLADHLRNDPDDEVADPLGGSKRRFRSCATQIDAHLSRLVDLAWPTADPTGGTPGIATLRGRRELSIRTSRHERS